MPKLSYPQIELVMREKYEAAFRIRPPGYNEAAHPLAAVELFAAEDLTRDSLLREYMLQFYRRGLGKFFNISWFEWLQLPSWYADELLSVAAICREEEDKGNGPLMEALKAFGSGSK